MWLLKKISCEIQILNEKVWKLMIENGKLEKENKKLKNMINTAIGIAYSKDDYDAIEYLVHERDGSEYFTLKDIKNGKTKGKRNRND